MSSIEVDGRAIACCADGSKEAPALLFSNSLGSNLSMWEEQVAVMEAGFRVLRYDNPGHGASASSDRPLAIADLARVAEAVMDFFGVRRAHVVGLSMGGMVGMHLAARTPDRVERLVVANSSAFMPDKVLWEERIRAVREEGMESVTETILERWFTERFRKERPREVQTARRMLNNVDSEGYIACCAAVRDMDLRGDLARISCPTLVIAGAHDPVTPPAMAEEIASGIKGARVETLDASHLSNIEADRAFNHAVGDFLRE